jgi:hypothetical protein
MITGGRLSLPFAGRPCLSAVEDRRTAVLGG